MQKNNRYLYAALTSSFIIYLFAIFKFNTTGINDLGTFGDFIGGSLNPILSFLSFLILIQTIRYQHEALETSRNELELTREELKRSADAQEATRIVQEQQATTQLLQQFENTFFSLLEQIKSNEPEKELIEGVIRNACDARNKNILLARGTFQNFREIHSHYFRTIYQTLKFLDKKSTNNSSIDISFYKNILRSSLTPNTTILLAINSAIIPRFINLDTHLKYKNLIEKYSMLQHMPFRAGDPDSNRYVNNNYILMQMLGCYEIEAFAENIYLQRLIKDVPEIIQQMKESAGKL